MYKSKLQELCHQYSWTLPVYTAVKEGPDHNPRFRATVTVNGVHFQTPDDQFRSSKEAQNHAAHLAFDHFTSSAPLRPSTFSRAPGSAVSNTNGNVGPANIDIMQPSLQPTIDLNVDPKGADLNVDPKGADLNVDPKGAKDISRLYKSRLQIYAQKNKLAMPIYSYETDGPPHARRFKSTVTIDGKSYTAADLYSTMKEAENTAAKVALESLSGFGTQEDGSLHKSLLQELTQKEGFGAPIYDTVKSGPPHMPTFVSTVRIKGKAFQGQEAKTKKQAEMNAAKTAYDSLTDCPRNSTLTHAATDEYPVNVVREHQWKEAQTNINIEEINYKKDKGRIRSPGIASEVSYYRLKPTITNESPVAVTNEILPNLRAPVENFSQDKRPYKDVNTNAQVSKPLVSSPESDVIHGDPHNLFSSTSGLPGNESAFPPLPLDYFADSASNIKRVTVCPQHPNSTYPQDSAILPCTDEKWVALKYETSPSH